jgi:hypothetical protein
LPDVIEIRRKIASGNFSNADVLKMEKNIRTLIHLDDIKSIQDILRKENPDVIIGRFQTKVNRKYICSYCRYSFRCNTELANHQTKKHDIPDPITGSVDKKPHVCGYGCSRTFASRQHVHRHMDGGDCPKKPIGSAPVTNKKTFKCAYSKCVRKFGYIQTMNKHMKTCCFRDKPL